jgi:Domain of unknown function (DUF4249)
MLRYLRFALLYLLLLGCVEPFEFVVKNNQPRLVVEGHISDKSFNETLLYPSDGRRFTVKLRTTSDVTNTRDQVVSGALVQLLDDSGGQVSYTETNAGIYLIADDDFKAFPDRRYKLRISLPGDEIFESSWEIMPDFEDAPMGNIAFNEIEKQAYKYIAGEQEIRPVKGINAFIHVPEQDVAGTLFYKWDFTAHWIFIAPLPPLSSPVKKCWVANPSYLPAYALQEDHGGGYDKVLFFMETVNNERIYEDFSVLVQQEVLSKDYYFFLKEMQEQDQGPLLSDKPPFNLQTNIKSADGETGAIGYFAVTREQAERWYFNKRDLSYPVVNNLKASCTGPPPFVPPPGCENCLEYQFGEAQTNKPTWWRQ